MKITKIKNYKLYLGLLAYSIFISIVLANAWHQIDIKNLQKNSSFSMVPHYELYTSFLNFLGIYFFRIFVLTLPLMAVSKKKIINVNMSVFGGIAASIVPELYLLYMSTNLNWVAQCSPENDWGGTCLDVLPIFGILIVSCLCQIFGMVLGALVNNKVKGK